MLNLKMKNNMTTIKYPIMLLSMVVMILLTGCEDFLETDSPSSFTDDYIFSNEDDAYKAVKSIYQAFTNTNYTSRLMSNFGCNTDVEYGYVHEGTDNTRRDLWSFRATPDNSEILGTWNLCYLAINRANECIEGIQGSSLYPASKTMRQLLGESLALRAFWYHRLTTYWGDVPFKTTPTKAGDEFYLPRTDRDTILTHLINDLIEIEPEMYWAEQLPEGIERVSRDFVISMISRLSLFRGGYALREDFTMKRKDDYLEYYRIANTYCKKLVELKPRVLDNFSEVFRNEAEYIVTSNKDVIFEVPFNLGNGDVAWNIGLRVVEGKHPYGTGNNMVHLPITYLYSFDTLDSRLPVSFAMYYLDGKLVEQPIDFAHSSTRKWSRTWMPIPSGPTSAKGTGINWPIIRYADVLLMLAETENELNNGPSPLARESLAQVRQRAFPGSAWTEKVNGYIDGISGSKESFFNAIVNERAWEFGGECYRKGDLARWNLYGEKIAWTRNTMSQIAMDLYSGTGEYALWPKNIYFRHIGAELDFFNQYGKIEIVPPIKDSPNLGDNPDGYEVQQWLSGLYNDETGEVSEYVTNQWIGYKDNTGQAPVRYLLPIHQSVISSSLGKLDNNGYGF